MHNVRRRAGRSGYEAREEHDTPAFLSFYPPSGVTNFSKCTHIHSTNSTRACAFVRSLNQTDKASLVNVVMLEDGKISTCLGAVACGRSGHRQSPIPAECSNIRHCEPSQMLSASFQLATEVILEDCCQQKDHISHRGS